MDGGPVYLDVSSSDTILPKELIPFLIMYAIKSQAREREVTVDGDNKKYFIMILHISPQYGTFYHYKLLRWSLLKFIVGSDMQPNEVRFH